MTISHELLDSARAALPTVVAVRRTIHRRPEQGLDLPETQRTVMTELAALGLEGTPGRSIGSVTAVIDGARRGPTILLRADMDALPLQEDTGLDFASEVPGSMHACGHDTHVAMLLGAARLLLERRDAIAGRILLMFQPGEEGFHGARVMLEEGLLDAAAPSEVRGAFALHISSRYASGTVHLRPGAQMASGDTLRITINGRGGHASTPHLALDPIAIAAPMLQALLAVPRRLDPFDPVVLTIANLVAGTTTNIIPETAFMQGTMRTVSEKTRVAAKAHVRQLVEGIAAAHGASATLEIEPGYPVTTNDPAFAEFVREVAVALVGEGSVATLVAPVMGAEDFSYVLQRVPGAMAFLGAAAPGTVPEEGPQNHSNRVVFDEPAMAVGAALYAAVALAHLAPH